MLGDPFGVNAGVMCELGYTVLKKDEAGQIYRKLTGQKPKRLLHVEIIFGLIYRDVMKLVLLHQKTNTN